MATSQYIGARYVPLFAEPAQWDKTKQYEPLTIVLDHGNSYTSRQFVPVGIELTNEAFWALTGNYNAQVEQYRQEVTTYDARIKTAQTTADGAASKATEADNKATNANAAIEAEVTRATAKEAEIQSLAEANDTDISHLDEQMAATTGSELLNRINNETSDRTEAINAEKTERIAADAALGVRIDSQKSELESLIASKFPIGTDAILDGSITSTKLAQSAINALLNGTTIRCFDSTDNTADNDGLICPSGFRVHGCYIEALKMLIINMVESSYVSWNVNNSTTNGITLPRYVPDITKKVEVSGCGIIMYKSGSDFASWSGLYYNPGRYVSASRTIAAEYATSSMGATVVCLAPYIAGETVTNSQYADYARQNTVI